MGGSVPANRPFKTNEELASLLIDGRGLACEDPETLVEFLGRFNYCRLVGYARQFQRDPEYGDDRFAEGTTFEDVEAMTEADQRLRELMFKQLSTVEIGIRSVLAHELARRHGNAAFYLDESSYLDLNGRPEAIVGKLAGDLARSKSPDIARYADERVKGDDVVAWCERYRDVPIWSAVEVTTFGRIANMVKYLADRDAVKAAAAVLAVQWDPFGSVVHSLSVARNLCFHHRQLWHRTLDIQCPVQKKLRPRGVKFDSAGPYPAIIMANHYRKKIDGNTSVADEIARLLDENPTFAAGIYRPQPKSPER